jgi:hypothetical protein
VCVKQSTINKIESKLERQKQKETDVFYLNYKTRNYRLADRKINEIRNYIWLDLSLFSEINYFL